MSIGGLIKNFCTSPERKRLKAEIGLITAQHSASAGAGNNHVSALLNCAKAQQQAGDLDAGWKYLHEARRLAVLALDDHDLAIVRRVLASECQTKLDGWRRTATKELMPEQFDEAYPTIAARRSALYHAMSIRDGAYDNTYHKMRIIRGQMLLLSPILVALLVLFLLLVSSQSAAVDLVNKELTWKGVLAGMVLGGIGACLSALTTFAAAAPDKPIPATVTSLGITLVRPMIGAASGLIAVLALWAGIIDLEKLSPTVYMIIALAFGFSERVVIGTLSKIGKVSVT